MSPEKKKKIEKKLAKRAERQEEWKRTVDLEEMKKVQERIVAGMARSLARKARAAQEKEERRTTTKGLQDARDKRLESFKPGREFNATNKTNLFHGKIFGFSVVAGALLRTGAERSVYYAVAYTICSPRDRFSPREGRDRVGMRLLEVTQGNAHQFSFDINLSKRGALSPVRLAMLIHARIVMDVISHRVRFPEKMERTARKWTRRDWYWDNCFTPIEVKNAGTILGKARQV
jgi:hypothetical protein